MSETLYIELFEILSRTYPRDPEIVNEAMERLLSRVEKGPAIQGSLVAFALGIAKNVRLENFRKNRRNAVAFDIGACDAHWHGRVPLKQLKVLMRRVLSKSERDLYERYYLRNQHKRVQQRQALAEELGIGMDALYQRASRLSKRLRRANAKGQGSEAIR